MRLSLLLAAIIAAAVAGALMLSISAPTASAGGSCLRFRDLQDLRKVDDHTAIAHTRSSGKYLVTFRGSCRQLGRWHDDYYTVRLHSNSECFDHDDVLVFRYSGSCFIQSVEPMPAD